LAQYDHSVAVRPNRLVYRYCSRLQEILSSSLTADEKRFSEYKANEKRRRKNVLAIGFSSEEGMQNVLFSNPQV
jgi:hypothetical protein